MKTEIKSLLMALLLCLLPFIAQGQSILEFQSGTTIEVTSEADICADNVVMNGACFGSGTKCGFLPLPVELTLFTAATNFSYVELHWKTVTEVSNAGFDVERRTINAAQWIKVGSVAGSGSSNVPHGYSYTDNVGIAGTFSYRLKQIDQDGAFRYSQEMEVTIEAPKVFSLEQNYPDPFNPTTTIQFTLPNNGRATLKIFNGLGQEVATLFNDEAVAGTYHQVQFNASGFATGTYYARLDVDGKVQLKKMLLLK